jgi:HlyD family secretion protein
VEPQGEVISVGGPLEERISRLMVKENQQVKTGEILAYLESYEERLAERNVAASELAEAQTRLATEAEYGSAQVQEAESRIGQIETPQSLEVEAQSATVDQLAAELAAAQTDLNRFRRLRREGAVSQQALDDEAVAVRSKQAALNNAKATLAKLVQARSTDLQNARAQLQSAQAARSRSQSEIQVKSAARKLELAQARLERTIIRAPQPGQVLEIFTRSGEAISEDGILQLGNTQQMYVVAEVYETDVGKVKPGQIATITSNALPQGVQGTVEQVGLSIDKNDVLDIDPAADTDTRVVEVKIRLHNSRLVAGLTNLQVDVAIQP